jgi:protein tyrosine phosphatase (PTP) superfamily phosphohydrolase (DUF442 family)
MYKNLTYIIAFLVIASCGIFRNVKNNKELQDNFNNIFEYENFYIAGQPNKSTLKWIDENEVEKVINLRTHEEMQEVKSSQGFDEERVFETMGIEYINLPINGKSGLTPGNLEKFIDLIDSDTKTIIHCRSASRVSYMFYAYLVKEKKMKLEEAIKIAKQLKDTSLVNKLLGK